MCLLCFLWFRSLLADLEQLDLELQGLEDVPRNLSDHLGIVDDQTAFHAWLPTTEQQLIKCEG